MPLEQRIQVIVREIYKSTEKE